MIISQYSNYNYNYYSTLYVNVFYWIIIITWPQKMLDVFRVNPKIAPALVLKTPIVTLGSPYFVSTEVWETAKFTDKNKRNRCCNRFQWFPISRLRYTSRLCSNVIDYQTFVLYMQQMKWLHDNYISLAVVCLV